MKISHFREDAQFDAILCTCKHTLSAGRLDFERSKRKAGKYNLPFL